jgi:hypothetical protein
MRTVLVLAIAVTAGLTACPRTPMILPPPPTTHTSPDDAARPGPPPVKKPTEPERPENLPRIEPQP